MGDSISPLETRFSLHFFMSVICTDNFSLRLKFARQAQKTKAKIFSLFFIFVQIVLAENCDLHDRHKITAIVDRISQFLNSFRDQ